MPFIICIFISILSFIFSLISFLGSFDSHDPKSIRKFSLVCLFVSLSTIGWLLSTINKDYKISCITEVIPTQINGFYAVSIPGLDDIVNVNKYFGFNIEDGDKIEIIKYESNIVNGIDFGMESNDKYKMILIRKDGDRIEQAK